MTDPDKPKVPPDGRRVFDAMRRVLAAAERGEAIDVLIEGEAPPIAQPPEDSFADGAEAARVARHLGLIDSPAELGEWIEPVAKERPVEAVDMTGPSQVIRFPAWLHRWFASLTPELTAEISAGARERLEQRIIGRAWRNARRVAVGGVVVAALVMHWFADQVAWIMERAPVLRDLWRMLMGIAK